MPRDTADNFRSWVAGRRELPVADEEHFRLVSGFNDIFVAIAAIIALVAAGSIGGGLLVAAVAWGLAEFFTRKRRMALPSIVLLVAFVSGLFSGLGTILDASLADGFGSANVLGMLTIVLLSVAGASYLHWWRFKVPIAIAAITGSLAMLALVWLLYALGMGNPDGDEPPLLLIIFCAGLAVFAFAMWWDVRDRERSTRRSDVAFWLHLLAAPLLVHPLFISLGAMDGDLGAGGTLLILLAYALMGVIALIVDRRAMLVSALAYVLVALAALLRTVGGIENDVAITALVIGGILLLLSAFWSNLRTVLVSRLPASWQARLPVTHFGDVGARVE